MKHYKPGDPIRVTGSEPGEIVDGTFEWKNELQVALKVKRTGINGLSRMAMWYVHYSRVID